MYAVIETGGKQYRVAVGDTLAVEKLDAQEGEVIFDRVLLVSDGEGTVSVGKPIVEGATVRAAILAQRRGPKIRGFKYKPKDNYRRRYGHRQAQTVVRVAAIEG